MAKTAVYNTLPRGLGVMVPVGPGRPPRRVAFNKGNNTIDEDDLVRCMDHPIAKAWFEPGSFKNRQGFEIIKRFLVPGHFESLRDAETAGVMIRD